jgi:hypothetical protein
MKSSQTPGDPGEQEQPSPFAHLPAYPEHAEHTASGVPGHGDMPHPEYAPVARYEITHNKIFDDSGNLRFTVRRNRSICDPSGYELAAVDEHPFRLQVDVTRNGYVVASVHAAHLGIGEHYTIDSPAGQFTASGHFFSHGLRADRSRRGPRRACHATALLPREVRRGDSPRTRRRPAARRHPRDRGHPRPQESTAHHKLSGGVPERSQQPSAEPRAAAGDVHGDQRVHGDLIQARAGYKAAVTVTR